MILVAHEHGSRELQPIIERIGVPAQIEHLSFGDFAFEGHGPKGSIAVGVERKTLHDMLRCIEDSRYSARQLPGMRHLYDKSYLILEGVVRPHDPEGWLMEWFPTTKQWGYCRPSGNRVLYSKLRRYLFSVALADVTVLYSRDMFHTAYDVCELFHYYQKKWSGHTALIETQKLAIPTLDFKPTLVRRWASDLEDIGVKYSQEAERLFKTPMRLAQSDEQDWMRIKGIGAKTAIKVIKEIHGCR